MIEFKCPKCQRRLKATDEASGKRARCPACRCEVTVPRPACSVDEVGRALWGDRPTLDDLSAAVRERSAEQRHGLDCDNSRGTGRHGARTEQSPPGEEPVKRPPSATLPSAHPPERLRHRRPAFFWMRSGLGLFLLLAFFLPWLEVSCNNNIIMHPSAFNLITGIPDAKTKGLKDFFEKALKEPDSPFYRPSDSEESAPSYWNLGRGSNGKTAESIDRKDIENLAELIKLLISRIALTCYGVILMPALVLLCALLLYGQCRVGPPCDPTWDSTVQGAVTVMALVGLVLVLIFALLGKPGSIPPAVDVSYDWGFYLTVLSLGGWAGLLLFHRRQTSR